MKIALVATVVTLFGFGGPEAGQDAPPPRLESALAEVRAAAAAVEIAAPESEPASEQLEALAEPLRIHHGRRTLRIPETCRSEGGSYDLVVHFHGAPTTVEPAFERAGINAMLVTLNLGLGSGPYEKAFASDGSLARLLDWVKDAVEKHCPMEGTPRKLGRLALSAWSAGYGAVYHILSHPNDSAGVDAVLLADGLHAGFTNKWHTHVNPLQMVPFDDFAAAAARGEKLMTITHSSIVPPNYASTTQTANYLIAERGIQAEKVDQMGPRDMHLISRADVGGFHVRGYTGGDTDAHCDHLYALDKTVFADLAAYWSK